MQLLQLSIAISSCGYSRETALRKLKLLQRLLEVSQSDPQGLPSADTFPDDDTFETRAHAPRRSATEPRHSRPGAGVFSRATTLPPGQGHTDVIRTSSTDEVVKMYKQV